MVCKRCGAPLPSEGFVCKQCGMMFDEEQIKMQKEQEQGGKKVEYVTEKYGGQKQLFKGREPQNNKKGFLIPIIFLILLILVMVLVYFW